MQILYVTIRHTVSTIRRRSIGIHGAIPIDVLLLAAKLSRSVFDFYSQLKQLFFILPSLIPQSAMALVIRLFGRVM